MKALKSWTFVVVNVVIMVGMANGQMAFAPATMPPNVANSAVYQTSPQLQPVMFAYPHMAYGQSHVGLAAFESVVSCDGSGGCSDCGTGSCSSGSCSSGSCSSGCCSRSNGTGMFGLGFGSSGTGACGSGNCGSGFGGANGPGGTGGCCLPRWFDFSGEWLFWKRDTNESLALSSEGIVGPIVLDTGDLEIEEVSGFRVSGAYLIAPATALEVSYFGGFNFEASSVANSNGNLFSVFSDFGSDPLNGFTDTGFGNIHSVALSSELNSAELNVRRRWVSSNCLIHSSWLIGARYVRFADDLVYNTQTNTGAMSYVLKTDNDLVGVQIGIDGFICISPRFKMGGEVKTGVLGSHSNQRTDVTYATGSLQELESESDVSFVGEAGAYGLFRVTPRLTAKIGYQVLYLDGVAVGSDNFNTESPFSARQSFVNAQGNVLYHGATLGFEFMW